MLDITVKYRGEPINYNILFHRYGIFASIVLLSGFSIFSKVYYFDNLSDDSAHIILWLDNIRYYGLTRAYGYVFSDYAPLYLYIIGIADSLLPWVWDVYVIKLVSLMGEGLAAYFTYRIVALEYNGDWRLASLTAAGVFALPSVIINGAAIGQSDIFYTAFLLASLYALMKGNSRFALAYFGVAFAFKQQALFFAPVIFAALLKGLIPWRMIWIPAAILAVSFIPSWLEGRPLVDLYYAQLQYGQGFYYGNAANFYFLLNNFSHDSIIRYGFCVAIATALVFSLANKRWLHVPINSYHYVLLATVNIIIMPFLLPKMHERYFFAAQLFAFILACIQPKFVMAALLLQCSAIMNEWKHNFSYFADWLGASDEQRLHWAAFMNLGALVILFFYYYRDIISPSFLQREAVLAHGQ